MISTTARNATLEDTVALLRVQHDAKNDRVVPAMAVSSLEGIVQVDGMGMDGDKGFFRPTEIFDEHLAEKTGIPLPYLRKLRKDRPDLLDESVNEMLGGCPNHAPDDRKFFVRTFMDPDGGPGIARGMLSDTYRVIDNLDVLMSALAGIKKAGVDAEIEKCQVTERRMSVDVVCPEIGVKATELLRDYRNPFNEGGPDRAGGWSLERARAAAARENKGFEPGAEPMMWAGFQISNSELGGGAFVLTPRVVFSICRNGLKLTRDLKRRVHLGGKLDEGVVWSSETHQANIALITSMTADAIATWLTPEYVGEVHDLLAAGDKPLEVSPIEFMEMMGNRLAFSETEQHDILSHFIRGGQMSTLGMVNAVTSYAQCVPNADRAYDLENSALAVLTLA